MLFVTVTSSSSSMTTEPGTIRKSANIQKCEHTKVRIWASSCIVVYCIQSTAVASLTFQMSCLFYLQKGWRVQKSELRLVFVRQHRDNQFARIAKPIMGVFMPI